MTERYVPQKCGKVFDPNVKDCQTCPDNVSCFEEFVSTLQPHCNALSSENTDDYCSDYHQNGCSLALQNLCSRMKKFYKTRNETCANFGTPKLNPVEKCISCSKELFNACDEFDLFLKNTRLTKMEVSTILENQLHELRTETGRCFEKFAFEDTCWSECDYKLRCLMGSGIAVDGTCRFFPDGPKPIDLEIEKITLSEECEGCMFTHSCISLCEERIASYKKEKEEKKMFQNFFSIGEIRNQFIEEE